MSRESIRVAHVIEEPERHDGPRHCDACWGDWPCDTVRLLAVADAAAALLSQEPDCVEESIGSGCSHPRGREYCAWPLLRTALAALEASK